MQGCPAVTDSTDLVGDSAGSGLIDPMLDPLVSNGGPTQTHALQSGSPALDAGNPAGCADQTGGLLTWDQRGVGYARSKDATGAGTRCDIGAFEL